MAGGSARGGGKIGEEEGVALARIAELKMNHRGYMIPYFSIVVTVASCLDK